jgi:polygalacturonase
VDGGILEDISINNITMIDPIDYAIYITTGKRDRTPNLATSSRARNILISNIVADHVSSRSGIQIFGLPGLPVQGIRLDNIRLNCDGGGTETDTARKPEELGGGYPEPSMMGVLPAYGVYVRHAEDLELANIMITFETNDARPAMICTNVSGLEIDNFKTQVADGVAPAKFEDVTGLVIRESPGLSR